MYDAAQSICSNWAPGNSKAGDWRLPTQAELTKIKNYVYSKGTDAIQLCMGLVNYSITSGALQCAQVGACYSSTSEVPKNICQPARSFMCGGSGSTSYGFCSACKGTSSFTYTDCFANFIWGQDRYYLGLYAYPSPSGASKYIISSYPDSSNCGVSNSSEICSLGRFSVRCVSSSLPKINFSSRIAQRCGCA